MRRIILSAALAGLAACSGRPRDAVPAAADRTADAAAPVDKRPVVLCFGTSLTAGLGLAPEEAYPALLQRKVDSAGLGYRIVNAGVSGETSAAGLRRIDWLLGQPQQVAVLLLELGANNALRGQDLGAAKRDLQAIIDRTRARFPDVRIVVAGMAAPPNLGARYTREFREMFVDLARANRAALIPFLLEGVAGRPEVNQTDGIHPTAEGERFVAANVWKVLEPVLRSVRRETGT
ncbi:MAG TPA: arylesterase [Gemmatimonadales bacterium]